MLRRLATILIKPRDTMRAILDSPRDRMVLPLVALAMLSGIFGDFDRSEFQRQVGPMQLAVIAGIVVGGMLLMIGLFYVFSWIAYLIATRLFEGTGTWAGTRSAMAWGLAPSIWALLYRVPVALFLSGATRANVDIGSRSMTFDPGRFQHGCIVALLIGLLELTVIVWVFFTESHALGEAHRFSSLRGLATFLMTCAAPFVVTLAAALSML